MSNIKPGSFAFTGSNSVVDRIPASHMPKRVKIFDCDKKQLLHHADSVADAAKYLGLHSWRINDIIKNKKKNKTNKLGLTITCR